MKGSSVVLFSTFLFATLPDELAGKGPTVKITVSGPGLAAPLAITDPNVGEFAVWSGPGVFVNRVEQTEGFIIEWSKGTAAELPAGLDRYEVSFFAGCNDPNIGCRSTEPRVVYVVTYAYRTGSNPGFVYLPGRRDDTFRLNEAMWHGDAYHGKWLHATAAWEKFVRPIIAKARAR